MSYETVLVEKKENYAIITFNRPTKFNAANGQLFSDLAAAVKELDADENVGCIVLTGQTFTHPKKGTPYHVFSAGADVEQFSRIGEVEAGYEFIKICFEPFKAIENSETPVIAAVNGSAFGFGFEIQGCCDFSFASTNARFALKELNHGAIPAWAITRGVERYGNSTIAYLAMSTKELDPAEARRLGIVIDVFEPDQLLPEVEALAARIAGNSTYGKTYVKRLLNRNNMEQYQDAERFMPAVFASKFMQDAFARFLGGETKNVKN
jgi:enoyl-CoA hydratase